jgi:hypothetical protein
VDNLETSPNSFLEKILQGTFTSVNIRERQREIKGGNIERGREEGRKVEMRGRKV